MKPSNWLKGLRSSQAAKTWVAHIVLFLGLAVVPLWNVGFSGVWSKADLDYPLYPLQRLASSLTTWNHLYSTGAPSITSLDVNQMPAFLELAFLDLIGIPINIANRIYLISTFVLLAAGSYYLVSQLVPFAEPTLSRRAGIIAATFAVFNPYVPLRLYFGHVPQLQGLAISQLILALLIKALHKGEAKPTKYAVLAGLLTPLVSAHVEFLVLFTLFVCLFFVFVLISDRTREGGIRKVGPVISTFAVISVALNSWWFFPLAYSTVFTNQVSFLYQGDKLAEGVSIFLWHGQNLARSGATQMLLRAQFILTPLPDVNWYDGWVMSPPFIALGLSLFGLMSLAFVFKARHGKVIFLATLTILFLGLAMGNNPPFGPVYLWLLQNFWLAHLFKVSDKFLHLAMIGYPAILGISAVAVCWRTARFLKKHAVAFRGANNILYIAVIALIFVNSFPMLSGNLNGVLEPMQVPNYYYEARQWLNAQGDNFRILPIYTLTETWWTRYDWEPRYNIVPITRSFFTQPILAIRLGEEMKPESRLVNLAYRQLLSNSTSEGGGLLNLLNVRYVLVQNDLLRAQGMGNEAVNMSEAKLLLSSKSDLRLARIFGKLDFYENMAWQDFSIYGAPTQISIPNWTLPPIKLLNELPRVVFVPGEIQGASYQPQGLTDAANWATSYRTVVYVNGIGPGGEPSVTAAVNSSAAFTGFPPGTPSDGWTHSVFDPPGTLNWTDTDYIVFWFKISSLEMVDHGVTNALNLIAYDTGGTEWREWTFASTISLENTWQKVTLPFQTPWIQTGNFDPSGIDYLRIGVKVSSPTAALTYFVSGLGTLSLLTGIGSSTLPSLSYRAASPTKYEVSIQSITQFTLVFSETYATEWSAWFADNNERLEHIVVNDYLNGWVVSRVGNFTIVIEYRVQAYLSAGFLITSTSLMVSVGLLVVWRRRVESSLSK